MCRKNNATTLVAALAFSVFFSGCGEDSDFVYLDPVPSRLYINEILASNDFGIADPDFGEFSDWFELYNSGDEEVDLTGMYLTDDASDTTKWKFPSGTIRAGRFLVVWADKKDTVAAGYHTNFKLSADGEEVALFSADLEQIDIVVFGEQTSDTSYARIEDGADTWEMDPTPTPGTNNNGEPLNPQPVFLSAIAYPNRPGATDTVTVVAIVRDDDSVGVYVTWTDGIESEEIPMDEEAPDSFVCVIPPMPLGTTVTWYITAVDADFAVVTSPADAPVTAYTYTVGETTCRVFINEFLASNDSVNADPDHGEYGDWVELYNPGESVIDLSGWHLTDDLSEPAKWTFPQGVEIQAGGYLLVWTDDFDEWNIGIHTNFKLSKGGEEIGLFTDTLVPEDTTVFGTQTKNISSGRSPDGGETWTTFVVPTPAAANQP